ncbi:MAG: hypothetical protein U0105_07540 [Candidatus Obscuribacterales bacterium]
MAKADTQDGGEQRKPLHGEVSTTAKVAHEAISSEPMAAAYEPKFKSFSGAAAERLGAITASVAEFCIEDKEQGKLITAKGEHSNAEPRHSFLQGLKQVLQGGQTPEESDRLQAEFSIAYMMRKASQFMQETAGRVMEGLQGIADSVPASQSKDAGSADQNLSNEKLNSYLLAQPPTIPDVGEIPRRQNIASEPALIAEAPELKTEKSELQAPLDHVQEFESTPKAIIGEFRRVLGEQNRNVGEFSAAIAKVDGHTFGSGMHYGPGFEYAGSQWHTELFNALTQLKQSATVYGLAHMKTGGVHRFKLEAILHTHPDLKDATHDPWAFSSADIDTARAQKVPSYLLRPDGSIIRFDPNNKYQSREGEVIGKFDAKGRFNPAPKFAAEFSGT